MSRENKLAKNTVILSIGTFLPKLAAFFTLPILTACLSKEQYGTYDLISILVSLVLPVTTLQIHTAAFRFLIEHNGDRELAKKYFSNIIVFVVPVAIVSLSVLYFFLPVNDIQIKIWTIIYLFFDTIVAEVRQITRGLSRNLDYSISAIISALVKMVLALLLVQFLKYELKGAVIALALSPILSLLYLSYRIKVNELIDFKQIDKSVLKEMLSYSWPMVPNNMSGWVMRASDRFVVTGFMGLASNAVYGVANKLPSLLTLAQSTFAMAWQENASIVSKDEDASNYYSRMFTVMANFYAGCLGIIVAFTPVLFRIFIRGDYSESIPQMPVLYLAMFFSCMASFEGGIYIAKKATKSVGITTVLAAICNLVVNLSLIQTIGLFAASGSTLISYLLLFAFRMKNLKKIIDIQYDYKRLCIAILIILIECGVSYLYHPAVKIANACFSIAAFYYLNRQIVKKVYSKLFRHAPASK